jgi:CRP-like cAMP-binding protein
VRISETLKQCPLFFGIDVSQLVPLLDCLKAVTRKYRKDEFVFVAGDKATAVGVVLSGGVRILQEDFWGNRTILAHIDSGGSFGEAFSCSSKTVLPVSVATSEPSEIMTIDYQKIVTTCSSACVFHTNLIMNMMRILAEKNILLTKKLEHLSKRTTRDKLLSFLSSQAFMTKNTNIVIPFNKTELAEYLCVDRSALSREISSMRDDGIIQYNKRNFTLLNVDNGWSCLTKQTFLDR